MDNSTKMLIFHRDWLENVLAAISIFFSRPYSQIVSHNTSMLGISDIGATPVRSVEFPVLLPIRKDFGSWRTTKRANKLLKKTVSYVASGC